MIREYLIRLLGGFASIDEAIEEIKQKQLPDRKRILTLAVKSLFNTISKDDILQEKNGKWFFMGRELGDSEKKLLIAQANQFHGTKFWEILKADVLYQANRKMFILAQDDTETLFGKFWLYIFDMIETRVKSMKKESGIYNVKK